MATIEGLEFVLKQATKSREQAEEQLEKARHRRRFDLKRQLSGTQWVESRFKLEAAHERAKQARELEARAKKELGEAIEREKTEMNKGERNRMARSMQRGEESPELEEEKDEKATRNPDDHPDCAPDAESQRPAPGDTVVEQGPAGAPAAATTPAPRKPPCPGCGARESTVRGTEGTTRYRRCSNCGRSFSTYEQVKK